MKISLTGFQMKTSLFIEQCVKIIFLLTFHLSTADNINPLHFYNVNLFKLNQIRTKYISSIHHNNNQ